MESRRLLVFDYIKEKNDRNIKGEKTESMKIVIPPSIRNFNGDESVLDEDTIELRLNKYNNQRQ
jgi:hypothetical protein